MQCAGARAPIYFIHNIYTRRRAARERARARVSRRACARAHTVYNNTCVELAGDDRDIDLYHWSSERFSAAWKTTISVLVAKGRARVGVAASVADWPKRIRDLQFLDHEGYSTAT